ncbi:MAG: PDZ domain-containing protein [Bacillota bacterium]
MFPFADVIKGIFQQAPSILIGGPTFLFYWLMVAVVALLYQRVTEMEKKVHGLVRNESLDQTIASIFHGFIAGLAGSFVLIFVGVSLSMSDTVWVIGLALILMVVDRRLICFSYAGGIVSLSALLFGWPKVNVPSLMGLVAILHITESLLIRFTGAGCATPVYLQHKSGRVVGGFTMQKYWPVPIVALVMALITDRTLLSGLTYMPDWWPLIRSPAMPLNNPNYIFTMIPVVAVIGYGDVAITCSPAERARRSARHLALYSLTLLGLAIAASRYPAVAWVAALFSPLGHEFIAVSMSRRETRGEPAFVPPPRGVRVLDAMPDSPARVAGLRSGDIVLEVNETPVDRKADLFEWFRPSGPETHAAAGSRVPGWLPHLNLTVLRGHRRLTIRATELRREGGRAGLVMVPEEGDEHQVEARTSHSLKDFMHRAGEATWQVARWTGDQFARRAGVKRDGQGRGPKP